MGGAENDEPNDMGRVFDGFFRPARHRAENHRWDWLPAVDVLEAGDHIEIRAEVPGLSEKDVHVFVTDDVLTLRGEKGTKAKIKKTGVTVLNGVTVASSGLSHCRKI